MSDKYNNKYKYLYYKYKHKYTLLKNAFSNEMYAQFGRGGESNTLPVNASLIYNKELSNAAAPAAPAAPAARPSGPGVAQMPSIPKPILPQNVSPGQKNKK